MHKGVILGEQQLFLPPPTGESNTTTIYKLLEVIDNFKKTNLIEYQFIPYDEPIRLIHSETTPEDKVKMKGLFLKLRDYSEKNLKE